ncbi:MAG: acetate kinase [Clostridia bacterium]|nr:acetate kinase [Clostridia bacterium]
MNILVINAGSSSLKYQLFDMETKEIKAKGLCERIGIDGKFTYKPQVEGKETISAADVPMPTHSEAIQAVLSALVDEKNGVLKSMKEIDAVGHRVLHGGQKFSESVLINDAVIEAIKECIPLGPLHNPANLMGIEACAEVMPGVPQVAVFDTAFHQSMPKSSYVYAIPYEYYEKYGVRRYGFHGTSHRYVSAQAIELLGGKAEGTRVITCHLGNGSSMAAVKDGKCFDTSMGLTPLEGVPMGTRSGSMDPAIVEFIANKEGISVSETLTMLNKKSGVLGVSGVSSDFRDLDAAAAEGNERAQLALDIFAYSVKKYIGSYTAALGGVDAVVFTAGLGENSAEMRAKIVDGLEYLGIEIDAEKNAKRGTVDITGANSKVKVFVIPTNEELVIAMDTQEIVSAL